MCSAVSSTFLAAIQGISLAVTLFVLLAYLHSHTK